MTKKIRMFQVDAFADSLFTGNPAAVCILDTWPTDSFMQSVAAENNLSETAFLVSRNDGFAIRWFTPRVEVDLCGHATLAAGFVLFGWYPVTGNTIAFQSMKSGILTVSRMSDRIYLDFPADELQPVDDHLPIGKCIGIKPKEIFKGRSDLVAVLQNEQEVKAVQPDLKAISQLPARGLIVTARGEKVDFVSRFFAPQSGIDEDPVTGSAHTSLTPLWSAQLGKKRLTARQLSSRGGELLCEDKGSRILIGGKAVLYLTGEITYNEV